jgi:hypothetical protein
MTTRKGLLILVLSGVLLRVGLWACYEPATYPDTGTYISAAKDLLAGNFARSEGRRTPGYPLVIALVGESSQNIFIAQMAAGVLISILLFYVALLMTGRPGIAFLAGALYDLNLQQLFLEGAILSETVSTLSIVAVIAATLHVVRRLRAGRRAAGVSLLLGVLAGIAVLTRPQYVFLPLLLPLLVAYVISGLRFPTAGAVKFAGLATLPAVFIVFAWCAFLYVKTGFFTLSTQSGFGLVNHSVAFIEFAPDRYGLIRDILLKHRAERLAASGHYGNTIWYAWPEIKQATGLSLPEASRELQKMSMDLFVRHPVRYGASVAHAWIDFWTVPIFWNLETLTPDWLRSPLAVAWWVEHKLLRIVNLAFVILVFLVVTSRRARQRVKWDLDMTAISAIVFTSSLIQALADQGASSRYAVTIQALVVLVVMVALLRFSETRTQSAPT